MHPRRPKRKEKEQDKFDGKKLHSSFLASVWLIYLVLWREIPAISYVIKGRGTEMSR